MTDQLRRLLRPGRGRAARSVDVVLLVGALVGVHLLSVSAVALTPEGSVVASWWPAAGLGTGLAAVVTPVRRPLVLVAVLLGSLTGNLQGGRAPDVALLFAVFNTVEVVVTTTLLCRGRPARLAGTADVARLAGAVAAGATVLGLLVSTAVVLLLGASFLDTFATVTTSHVAAQLVVVPVVLALRSRPRLPRPGEAAVQAGVLVLVTELVFGVLELPLAFVPLTVLVWGAVRLGLRMVCVELLVVVVMVTLLTSDGYGPFAAGPGLSAQASTWLLQVFAVSYVVVGLTLSVAVGQHEEVAARVAASEALFRGGFTESLLGMLMLESRDGVLRVVRANPVACHLVGRSQEDLLGREPADLLDAAEGPDLRRAVRDLLGGRSTGWRHEVRAANPTETWVEIAVSVLPGPGAEPDDAVVSVQLVDVTARRQAQAQLARLALHDPLTGLANRVLLADRLAQVLAAAGRSGVGPALLFLDLDDFKQVNDAGGHAAGDVVLQTVAERISSAVRATDTVARLGGDEFVVLCPDTADPAAASALADRLVALVSRPVLLGGHEVVVRLSAGVVLGAPDCTAEDLMRDADTAMYAAKAQGKDRAVLFRAEAHTPPRPRHASHGHATSEPASTAVS